MHLKESTVKNGDELELRKQHELLKFALSEGDLEVYEALIRQGAPIVGYEKPGKDTLMHALAALRSYPWQFHREHRMHVIAYDLFQSGLSVTHVNGRGETPIHVAAKCKSTPNLYFFVDELIKKQDQIKNIVDEDGLSLFHIICTMPAKSYVTDFISNMDELDLTDAVSKDSKFCPGFTALHFAAAHYRCETVKLLVDMGADVTSSTSTGLTLLHLTCTMDQPDWLFHEISRNIPENDFDDWAEEAIDNLQIALKKRLELVDYLLDLDIGASVKDAEGRKAAYYVARANYTTSCYALIVPTLDFSFVKHKDVVFSYAWKELQEHHLSLIVYLYVGNLRQTNNSVSIFESRYFYDIAYEPNNSELTCQMINFLLKTIDKGANIVNEYLTTPLHVAVRMQNLILAKSFLEFYDDDCDKMVNVNMRDTMSNTTIHFVEPENTGNVNCAIVTLLLKHGIDLNEKHDKDSNGFARGFAILHNLILKITLDPNFQRVAESEKRKIELALSVRNYNSMVECHYWVEMFITAWKHLTILESCGAPINPGHGELLAQLQDSILISKNTINSAAKFKCFCKVEVQTLKNIHINKFSSLNDILTKDIHDVAVCTKNKVLQNIINSPVLSKRFPIYNGILRARFIGGLARKRLLDEATDSFKKLINRNISTFIIHKTFSYFNHKQLINVKNADDVNGSKIQRFKSVSG